MSLIDETTSRSMDLPERGLAPLDIQRDARRVRAMFAGHVIADSDDVLVLHRPGLPDMHFFPPGDVEIGYLGRTRQTLADPDLGPAACYTWTMDGDIVERAAGIFESLPPGAEVIRDRIWLSERVFEVYALTPHDLEMAPRATHPHGSAA